MLGQAVPNLLQPGDLPPAPAPSFFFQGLQSSSGVLSPQQYRRTEVSSNPDFLIATWIVAVPSSSLVELPSAAERARRLIGSPEVSNTTAEHARAEIAARSERPFYERRALDRLCRERIAAGAESINPSSIPYLAVVWALVANDQLHAARQLVLRLPEQPRFAQIRRLLALPRTTRSDRQDVDRSEDYRWLTEHGSEHRGTWVAVQNGALVASARTLKDLRRLLSDRALNPRPLIHFIP